eukprot:TRINITY_DN2127_c0_g1_i2.p1 TRINITY_DN2127_c0_g1~~TRINITY_DN2127_c0_g1_i2.p1  ORF type:complete len:210 (+),score=6.30 TRINITY_DN2127_c0_g1_i2:505-1134(+)
MLLLRQNEAQIVIVDLCHRMDLRYHHIPKIDQLTGRYYKVFEQSTARVLEKGSGKYQHNQVFVRPGDFNNCGTWSEKRGIAVGSGGDWGLDRFGRPVKPETSLASSTVGWHSKKTVERMAVENTVIPPRERVINGPGLPVPRHQPELRAEHPRGRTHRAPEQVLGEWRVAETERQVPSDSTFPEWLRGPRAVERSSDRDARSLLLSGTV